MKTSTMLLLGAAAVGGFVLWRRYRASKSVVDAVAARASNLDAGDRIGDWFAVLTGDGDSAISDAFGRSTWNMATAPENLNTSEALAIAGTENGSFYALAPAGA